MPNLGARKQPLANSPTAVLMIQICCDPDAVDILVDQPSKRRLLLFLVERLVVAGELLLELLDATHAIDELLLAGVERVRST